MTRTQYVARSPVQVIRTDDATVAAELSRNGFRVSATTRRECKKRERPADMPYGLPGQNLEEP